MLIIAFHVQPPADHTPQQVRLEWSRPGVARISWTHPAGANYWAVYKQTPWGWLTIEERFDARAGTVVVLMGSRGGYSPSPGAHYLIQVAQRDEGSGATEWSETHGPFTLGDWPAEWMLLPVVWR